MRPVDKLLYQKNEPTYNPYGAAKEDLIETLGQNQKTHGFGWTGPMPWARQV